MKRGFVSDKTNMSKIPAAVLSGGSSSRLGRDKSLLRLKGRTLTALTVGKLVRAGYGPVFVVGPKKAYGLPAACRVISERYRGRGPLSGIEAALRHAGRECLIIPCDLPFIGDRALKTLGRRFRGQAAAFRENPLPAVFPLRSLPVIQGRLKKKNLSVFPLLKQWLPTKGFSKRNFFNLNDELALKIVRSDKRVA